MPGRWEKGPTNSVLMQLLRGLCRVLMLSDAADDDGIWQSDADTVDSPRRQDRCRDTWAGALCIMAALYGPTTAMRLASLVILQPTFPPYPLQGRSRHNGDAAATAVQEGSSHARGKQLPLLPHRQWVTVRGAGEPLALHRLVQGRHGVDFFAYQLSLREEHHQHKAQGRVTEKAKKRGMPNVGMRCRWQRRPQLLRWRGAGRRVGHEQGVCLPQRCRRREPRSIRQEGFAAGCS